MADTLPITKRIIFNQPDTTDPVTGERVHIDRAALFVPSPNGRTITLTDNGRTMFESFPEDMQTHLTAASGVPAEMADKLNNPFAGVTWKMWRPETDDEFMARCRRSFVPEGATDVTIIEATDVPSDFTFMDSWKVVGGQLTVQMPAARDIWRNAVRTARTAAWAKADADVTSAQAKGDQEAAAAAEAKRQLWRDATSDPAIDAAETPEQLKAFWPEGLPGKPS